MCYLNKFNKIYFMPVHKHTGAVCPENKRSMLLELTSKSLTCDSSPPAHNSFPSFLKVPP